MKMFSVGCVIRHILCVFSTFSLFSKNLYNQLGWNLSWAFVVKKHCWICKVVSLVCINMDGHKLWIIFTFFLLSKVFVSKSRKAIRGPAKNRSCSFWYILKPHLSPFQNGVTCLSIIGNFYFYKFHESCIRKYRKNRPLQ